ncbi:MAG: hypothetical protein R2749_17120 [Acidimicrobiales bacterium]
MGLDEYAGLDADDPAAFRTQFRTELTEPLGIPAERLHTLDGAAADLDAECARFEARRRSVGCTGSCSASAATATSASTSPAPPSTAAPGWSP